MNLNKSYLDFRTDMADERVDTYKKVHNLSKIDGVIVSNEYKDDINIVTVEIINENGEKAIGKKQGKYITLELYDVNYVDEIGKKTLINSVAKVIDSLIEEKSNIMVIGLGNIYVTPDALGPKVVKYLDINRHLFKFAKELVNINDKQICALAPGVLGTTGIETSEIIESVVKKIKPDIIIAIDSLASQSMTRVGKTIQLSNTGLNPGSGVKNKRAGIDEETLNVPVIALGIPTVVDMATITNEAMDKVLEKTKEEIKNYNNDNIKETDIIMNLLNSDSRYQMIANTLNTENYIVTPKEIDELIDKMSEIIANSINSVIPG